MKFEQLHEGLPEKEIRDFFSTQLEGASSYKKAEYPPRNPTDSPKEETLKLLEIDLENLQKRIKEYKRLVAVENLVKNKGWQDWDVSDETGTIYGDCYYNFIGTEEEYNNFISKIKNNER